MLSSCSIYSQNVSERDRLGAQRSSRACNSSGTRFCLQELAPVRLMLAHAEAAQADVQRDPQTATAEIALPAAPPPLAGSQCLAWPHPSV